METEEKRFREKGNIASELVCMMREESYEIGNLTNMSLT
jgi:hypothetical protein